MALCFFFGDRSSTNGHILLYVATLQDSDCAPLPAESPFVFFQRLEMDHELMACRILPDFLRECDSRRMQCSTKHIFLSIRISLHLRTFWIAPRPNALWDWSRAYGREKMCFYKTMCAVQHQTSTSAVNKGAEGVAVGPRRQQPHHQTNYPIESAQVCFFVFFTTRGGLDDTADRR